MYYYMRQRDLVLSSKEGGGDIREQFKSYWNQLLISSISI